MINIIAAVAQNNAIGYQNKLLYWLPNDLKRFKQLTTGHTIIMGRKTFDSLPKGALPNRRNVVISRTVQSLPGCDVYPSLDEALSHCEADEDIYIIGGASISPLLSVSVSPRYPTHQPRLMSSFLTIPHGTRYGERSTPSTRNTLSDTHSLITKNKYLTILLKMFLYRSNMLCMEK